tara:strand:+ start:189 stop:410 length:222 start_codon:yes stop_codon:yes gene_type:complete
MGITTQKHINIIDELRERAIKDKAQLDGVLEPDERKRFDDAINNLKKTKDRMMIDFLQKTKQNITEELDRLNA